MRASGGLIGPNAILQYVPELERLLGRDGAMALLARAGLFSLPDGTRMIAEGDAHRVHRQVRLEEPELAPFLEMAAGARTADYVLAHRIPTAAQSILRVLPAMAAAPLLASAISRHAWTFSGSGRFNRINAWTFEIVDNPMARTEHSARPMCNWHSAVFERLYQRLVAPDCTCRETTCCAQGPGIPCRFEITL